MSSSRRAAIVGRLYAGLSPLPAAMRPLSEQQLKQQANANIIFINTSDPTPPATPLPQVATHVILWVAAYLVSFVAQGWFGA